MSTKLYVGSLPYSITNEELGQIFAGFGNVVSARVIIDKVSGRSKGFGFVEYDSDESAKKARESMHDSDVQGRKIVVNEAHPQKTDGGGGGQRRGGGGGGGGYRGGNSGGGRDFRR